MITPILITSSLIILGIVYLTIGIIIATIWGINNIPKNGDSEDYIMATFPILIIMIFWIMFIPILPVWIINKLRKDK